MTLERIETIPTLPPRPRDSHKGLFGSVLVVAGSRGMAGAAALCGAAALRSGAGLVRIATPGEVQPTVASFEPSYMTYPLPCDENGLIQLEPAQPILERLIADRRRDRRRAGTGSVGRHPAARAIPDHIRPVNRWSSTPTASTPWPARPTCSPG